MTERSLNWAIGLSVCSWAVLGLCATGAGSLGSPVRWGIALLNLIIGGLFITRRAARGHGGLVDLLQALPALLVGGLALQLAPEPWGWPWWTQMIFLLGTALTCGSLLRLGRCFAVLPAWRGVVSGGPYRWVRHPAYLGELTMVLGCVLAAGAWLGYVLLAGAVVLVVVRALAEERVLLRDPDYAIYRARTPDLLIPGLHRLAALLAGRGGVDRCTICMVSEGAEPTSGAPLAGLAHVNPEPGAP